MATQPKIALLPPAPSISKTYSPTLRSCIQQTSPPSSTLPPTPQTFLDAMTVREAVFVDEQKVALENEFDVEDPRCWHWVLYASEEPESEPKPAGTIRLVPFPQLGEEPRAGGVYFGGELVNAGELGGEFPFLGLQMLRQLLTPPPPPSHHHHFRPPRPRATSHLWSPRGTSCLSRTGVGPSSHLRCCAVCAGESDSVQRQPARSGSHLEGAGVLPCAGGRHGHVGAQRVPGRRVVGAVVGGGD